MKSKIYLRGILTLITGFVIAGSFLLPTEVLAQDKLSVWGDPMSGTMIGFEAFKVIGMGNRNPQLIIASVIQVMLGFLGVLSVLLLIYGGFIWMTAGGDVDKVQKSKDLIKNAVIGMLIILSAFSIATFILRALVRSTGGYYGYFNDDDINTGALGAMGSGIISSVYPAPNQLDVPRNTSIIVSFKEKIDPASICDKVVADKCDVDAKIIPTSIKIFQTNFSDKVDTNITDVRVASTDNKTFVFMPSAYLGSAADKLWYTVGLTTQIMKANKAKAFSIQGFAWQFEVSNILDLTPPKVLSAGVYPAPDNEQDQPGQVIDATFAEASILVNAQPRTLRPWKVTYTASNPGSIDLDIDNPKANVCDGKIMLAINNTNPPTANIAYIDLPGRVNVAEAPIINRKIQTACGFDIGILKDTDNFTAGQSWTLDLATQRSPDSLIIAASSYTFVDKLDGAKQILVSADTEEVASNIISALAGNQDVSATIDATNKSKVNLNAKVGGRVGNLLEILTTAVKDTITITPFAGGTDKIVSVKVMDKLDKPKNAVIQINFNEAINPLAVSGRSEVMVNNLKVLNGTEVLAGEFRLSNQYKTVEFITDLECGINGCGEKIYCLPGNANLKVELNAAALNSVCTTDADCVAKSPFTVCENKVCYDKPNTTFYPEGKLGTGIIDLASNSLDGNRDIKAIGPQQFYNDNDNTGSGDSFAWSFWTSDVLDLTPPVIKAMEPAYNKSNVNLTDDINIKFTKLMMSSSLVTGRTKLKKGDKEFEHQLINLRSLSKVPLGYWLENYSEEISNPPDTEPDQTVLIIKHSLLAGSNKYRAQVGSGIKDIYQNCYKPCAGPSCLADSNLPSCCNGTPTDLGLLPICPDN